MEYYYQIIICIDHKRPNEWYFRWGSTYKEFAALNCDKSTAMMSSIVTARFNTRNVTISKWQTSYALDPSRTSNLTKNAFTTAWDHRINSLVSCTWVVSVLFEERFWLALGPGKTRVTG